MRSFILILFLIGLAGCAGLSDWTKKTFEPKSIYDEVHENHLPTAKQRLIPRPSAKGYLTNKVCTKFYGDICEQTSIRKYDLKDVKVREKLNEFRFACKVGTKRYRICKDEPGLCRTERHRVCKKWGKTLFRRRKVCKNWVNEDTKKFLHIEKDFEFLLDGGTYCKGGM